MHFKSAFDPEIVPNISISPCDNGGPERSSQEISERSWNGTQRRDISNPKISHATSLPSSHSRRSVSSRLIPLRPTSYDELVYLPSFNKCLQVSLTLIILMLRGVTLAQALSLIASHRRPIRDLRLKSEEIDARTLQAGIRAILS